MNRDVLRIISEFLSPDALANASIIHPVFFALWMKTQYGLLEVNRSDKETKALWAHIRENPDIADLVTRVDLRPWLVKPQTQSYHSWTENAWNRFTTFIDPDYMKKQADRRFQKRLEKDIHRVRTTLFSLKNVTEYHVEWDGSTHYHPELFAAFLHPVLNHWQDSLTTLSLDIPPYILSTFVRVTLPKLQNVELSLNTGRLQHREIDIFLDGFLVFLHNLKDTLQFLAIHSTPLSENLDLSRFYRLLGKFPALHAVSLSIPFDGAQLSTPSSFSAFVLKHRDTLQELTLKTTRCSVHIGPYDPECMNWIQRIGSVETSFPNLTRIILALRPLKAPLKTLASFINLHASTLKSITLTDRVLDLDEINDAIISPLSDVALSSRDIPLEQLEIRVHVLSPRLLHLLASRLPCLKVLKLELLDRARSTEIARKANLLRSDLRRPQFDCSKWQLRRIAISPGPDGAWISAMEGVLVECIPSLTAVEEFLPPS